MEQAIGVEVSEGGSIQENEANKPTSDFGAPKQAADPVVYKLVRVDFDGRLVPATDNELMEVEDFFDYENSEILSVADVVHTSGFGFCEDDLPDKHFSLGDEALSQYENSKSGEEANVELNLYNSNAIVKSTKFILVFLSMCCCHAVYCFQKKPNYSCDDIALQKVAEEESHQAASSSPVHPSANVNVGKPGFDQHDNLVVGDNKNLTDLPTVEILSTSGSTLHDLGTNRTGSSGGCSNVQDEAMENETSASTIPTSLKPDFSLLRGEINLDKFTIRELQETFRATFGRGTSVKDKHWLKRRIAMGLVNSCDIPLESFIIRDNMLVNKVEDANCEKVDDVLVGETVISHDVVKDVQVNSDDKADAKSTILRNLLPENVSSDNSPNDQSTAKRVRKPTKRYIEELSDLETRETVGRLIIPSGKESGVTEDLPNSTGRSAWEIKSSAIIMRPDSLGGCGFQVPRVSRIRRCRPRKGIITLTPGSLEDELARDAVKVGGTQLDNMGGQKTSEARTVFLEAMPSDGEKSETEKVCSEIDIAKMGEEHEPKSADSSGNNPNCDFTAKGGMRRKHHRAWSLTEVVKLVDGVSRYGAGRWSEIKRISFASYSYRTSVDLKDKWRNLLKASFAAMPSDKGMSQQHQQRKPTTMPIPAAILLKVRELAEMNGQAPRNLKASNGSVNEE